MDTLVIPKSLARLLVAEKKDMKKPEQYDDVQALAKANLKVLLLTSEE